MKATSKKTGLTAYSTFNGFQVTDGTSTRCCGDLSTFKTQNELQRFVDDQETVEAYFAS